MKKKSARAILFLLCVSCELFTDSEGNIYQSCTESSCNNDGKCYQDIADPDNQFCSCSSLTYGDRCQNKVEENTFLYIVIGLVIFSVVFLILLVIIGWRLHAKSGEYQDFKMKVAKQKKENKIKKKQQNALLVQPRSRHSSTSSTDRGIEGCPIKKDGQLFQITSTGIERTNILSDEKKHNGSVALETTQMEQDRLKISRLSTVDGVTKFNMEENKMPNLPAFGNNSLGLLPMNMPGRPRSWAGPDINKREDMDQIYKEFYRENPDEEDNIRFDSRGYVRKQGEGSPSTSRSNMHLENLQRFNQMVKGESLTDLRMQGQIPGRARSETNVNINPMKFARSVENIHTGQITVLAPFPNKSPGEKRKKKGIYAKEMERKKETQSYAY